LYYRELPCNGNYPLGGNYNKQSVRPGWIRVWLARQSIGDRYKVVVVPAFPLDNGFYQ
jgi:hypothetical protein